MIVGEKGTNGQPTQIAESFLISSKSHLLLEKTYPASTLEQCSLVYGTKKETQLPDLPMSGKGCSLRKGFLIGLSKK